MQVIQRIDGPAPVDMIALRLTGPEYETILRGLRRLQVGTGRFQAAKANVTYAHKRRAEHLHRELTGRAR